MRKHSKYHPAAIERLEDRTALASSFSMQVPALSLAARLSPQVQTAIMNSPSFNNVANMLGSFTSNAFSNIGAAGNLGFTGTPVGLFSTGILNTPTGILGTSAGLGTGTTVVSPGLGSNSAANLGLTLANAANQAGTLTPSTISSIVSALIPNPSPTIGRTASRFSNFGTIGNLGNTVVTTGFQGTRVGLFGTGILNTPTGMLGTSAGFGNGFSVVSPGLGGFGFMGF